MTKRYYVGMHSTGNLEDGYFGSGKRLHSSIRKHGKENHVREILETTNSRIELHEREAVIVNDLMLHDPLCMNLNNGGTGSWEFINQHGLSPVTNRKHPRYEEVREKQQQSLTYKIRSKAWKKNDGIKGWWVGKRHKKTTIEKMKLVTPRQRGEDNGSYGTSWYVNKERTEERRCTPEQADKLGWNRGRKSGIGRKARRGSEARLENQ